jgi:S1-C subfamily serine protease
MSRTIPNLVAAIAIVLALQAYQAASGQQGEDDYKQSDAPALQDDQQGEPAGQDNQRNREEIPEQNRDRGQDNDASRADRQQRDSTGRDQSTRSSRPQDFNFGARFTERGNALTVGTINEGTIAADIGLQAEDEIIAVGERAVFSEEDLNVALRQSSARDERIPIVVRRDTGRATLFVEPQRVRSSFGTAAGIGDTDIGLAWGTDASDQLIVRDVTGGLAARLGLRARDVLVSVDGRRIASPAQFERWLNDVDFVDGRRLPIVVMRDGRRVTLFLEPAMVDYRFRGREYDDPDFYRGQEAWLGVTLDTNYDDYAVVQSVVPGSPAQQAGVRRGDWIVRLNGRRVDSPSHLTSLVRSMEPGDELEIEIARRVARTLMARLDADPASVSRQALRPTFDEFDARNGVVPEGRRYFRPDAIDEFESDFDRRGFRDRIGPGERGLRDRLDPDEIRDEPRGILPR